MKWLPIACLILCSTVVAGTGPSGEGWWADLYEQETVSLAQIVKNPTAFRDLDVTFVIQFQGLGTIENPFYTKFEKDRFMNFSAWADETPLWQKEEFKKNFNYLFVDRMAKETEILANARTYQRFLVVGRVESVFRGQPWIEVKGMKALDESLTEPTLIHLVKAYNFKRLRRFDAAAAEFHLANSVEKLPATVKAMSFKEEGVCLAAADRHSDALAPLEVAMTLVPKDEELKRLSDFCKAKANETPKTPEPKDGGDGDKKETEKTDQPKTEQPKSEESGGGKSGL